MAGSWKTLSAKYSHSVTGQGLLNRDLGRGIILLAVGRACQPRRRAVLRRAQHS